MTRRKRPPLTNQRKDYVQARASGLLVGEPLHYPAGVADRYRDGLDKLVQQMMREYKREVVALWREYAPPITQDASLASQSARALTRLKNKFARLFKERAPALIDRMLGGVDKASATGLQKSLKELSGGVTLKTDTMPAPRAMWAPPSSSTRLLARSTARRDGWGAWRAGKVGSFTASQRACSRLRPVAVGACSVTFLSVSSVASM